jgi:hypothetical protein
VDSSSLRKPSGSTSNGKKAPAANCTNSSKQNSGPPDSEVQNASELTVNSRKKKSSEAAVAESAKSSQDSGSWGRNRPPASSDSTAISMTAEAACTVFCARSSASE